MECLGRGFVYKDCGIARCDEKVANWQVAVLFVNFIYPPFFCSVINNEGDLL